MSKGDKLGELEQLALLAVLRLDGGAYGAAIQEELQRTADRDAAISTIHITLTRLEAKGLVSSEMASAEEGSGGRPRRYFRLQPAGFEALRESRERLLSMWTGVEERLGSA